MVAKRLGMLRAQLGQFRPKSSDPKFVPVHSNILSLALMVQLIKKEY